MPVHKLDLPETTTLEITVGGQPAIIEDAIILDTLLGESQKGYDLVKQKDIWQAKFRDLLNQRYGCKLSIGQTLVVMRATLEITQSLKKSLNDLQTSLNSTALHHPIFPQKNNGVCSPTSPVSKPSRKSKPAKPKVS